MHGSKLPSLSKRQHLRLKVLINFHKCKVLHGITIHTLYFGIEITRYLDRIVVQISNHVMAAFVEQKKNSVKA